MSAPTFDETIQVLVALSRSDVPLTPAPVDDIVDAYLVGFGNDTFTRRVELAEAFVEKAGTSRRSDQIHHRIMRRL